MTATPISLPEDARLAVLRRYGVLDTAAEPEFDEITRLAAQLCEAPVAVIAFVNGGRQWFKSALGLDMRKEVLEPQTQAARLKKGALVAVDASKDEGLKMHALVVGGPQ